MIFIVFLKLAILLYFVSLNELDVVSIFIIFFLLEACITLFAIHGIRKVNATPLLNFHKQLIILKENTPFVKEKIFELLLIKSIAIFYLSKFSNLESVAYFSFITSFSLLFINNFSILQKSEVVLNRIFLRDGATKKNILMLSKIFEVHLFFSYLVFLNILINSEFIFNYILNKDYAFLSSEFSFLILILFIAHLSYIFSPIIFVKNKINLFYKAAFLGGITNIFFLTILVPAFGFHGALTAYVLSIISKPFYYFIQCRNLLPQLSINFKYLFTIIIFCSFLFYFIQIIDHQIIKLTLSIFCSLSIIFIAYKKYTKYAVA